MTQSGMQGYQEGGLGFRSARSGLQLELVRAGTAHHGSARIDDRPDHRDSGLDHLPNAVLFYWVQGNMTGVNISLFNEYNDYVNLSRVEEPEITDLVACGSGVTLPPSAAAISRSIDLIPAPPVRRNSPVLRNERAGNARRLR